METKHNVINVCSEELKTGIHLTQNEEIQCSDEKLTLIENKEIQCNQGDFKQISVPSNPELIPRRHKTINQFLKEIKDNQEMLVQNEEVGYEQVEKLEENTELLETKHKIINPSPEEVNEIQKQNEEIQCNRSVLEQIPVENTLEGNVELAPMQDKTIKECNQRVFQHKESTELLEEIKDNPIMSKQIEEIQCNYNALNQIYVEKYTLEDTSEENKELLQTESKIINPSPEEVNDIQQIQIQNEEIQCNQVFEQNQFLEEIEVMLTQNEENLYNENDFKQISMQKALDVILEENTELLQMENKMVNPFLEEVNDIQQIQMQNEEIQCNQVAFEQTATKHKTINQFLQEIRDFEAMLMQNEAMQCNQRISDHISIQETIKENTEYNVIKRFSAEINNIPKTSIQTEEIQSNQVILEQNTPEENAKLILTPHKTINQFLEEIRDFEIILMQNEEIQCNQRRFEQIALPVDTLEDRNDETTNTSSEETNDIQKTLMRNEEIQCNQLDSEIDQAMLIQNDGIQCNQTVSVQNTPEENLNWKLEGSPSNAVKDNQLQTQNEEIQRNQTIFKQISVQTTPEENPVLLQTKHERTNLCSEEIGGNQETKAIQCNEVVLEEIFFQITGDGNAKLTKHKLINVEEFNDNEIVLVQSEEIQCNHVFEQICPQNTSEGNDQVMLQTQNEGIQCNQAPTNQISVQVISISPEEMKGDEMSIQNEEIQCNQAIFEEIPVQCTLEGNTESMLMKQKIINLSSDKIDDNQIVLVESEGIQCDPALSNF